MWIFDWNIRKCSWKINIKNYLYCSYASGEIELLMEYEVVGVPVSRVKEGLFVWKKMKCDVAFLYRWMLHCFATNLIGAFNAHLWIVYWVSKVVFHVNISRYMFYRVTIMLQVKFMWLMILIYIIWLCITFISHIQELYLLDAIHKSGK